MADATQLDRLVFHGVGREQWDDLYRLFMAPGGPKHCWCMVWRSIAAGESRSDNQAKRAALESRVREGVPIGILGHLDGEPVAWSSIAPRSSYRSGIAGRGPAADSGDGVWSIACFFVPRRLRRQGIMERLIAAAVEYGRGGGATAIEAYPVDSDSPSYRFMGFVSSFRKAGFREVGTAGSQRYVMRLTL